MWPIMCSTHLVQHGIVQETYRSKYQHEPLRSNAVLYTLMVLFYLTLQMIMRAHNKRLISRV